MTNADTTLTRTQTNALADLRELGHLWPADRTSTDVGRHIRYSRQTLNGLVSAGLATWATITLGSGVMPHIVPAKPTPAPTDTATETSADVYTRHLIVTLPDVSGDEVDSIAELIDEDVLTDGHTSHGTVTHALGATILAGGMAGVRARRFGTDRSRIDTMIDRGLSADEARQLAGALLTLAHDIDGK